MRYAILLLIATCGTANAQPQFRDINPAPMSGADWGRLTRGAAPGPLFMPVPLASPTVVVMPQQAPQAMSLRDYANNLIRQCDNPDERAKSESFNPFSAFASLSATPESMAAEQIHSCIARKFSADDEFVRGYFALLAELPGEHARSVHASVAEHAEAQTFRVDALGPWQLATRGCTLIADIDERLACFDAVLQSVPDRLKQ